MDTTGTAPSTAPLQDVEVAIIGSGFGGLCMGIKLKEAGIGSFVILEKDEDFGGTWRVNHYPGAACDVPSHLYSFSFAQNARWSRKFPSQPELWAYTQEVVERFGLRPYIHTDTALMSADFDEAAGHWHVVTSKGSFTAKFVVSATGALSRPSIPKLPGLESFHGRMFHSADWDHDYALAGKRVAVIGTGASAIQFVPEIAPQVAQLDLYQRTAPWVLPRPDRPISALEHWLLDKVKPLQWLYRGLTYLRYESRLVALTKVRLLTRHLQRTAEREIAEYIKDPVLRAKLTPDYKPGCKRLLLMNTYYPALARPNVNVCTDGIREVRERSIVGNDGVERPVDAIIFGTGFDVEHVLGKVDIRGRGGKNLIDGAQGGLEGYKGCTVAGFPNFFMVTGPNTGLGHNSIIYMIESGVNYIVEAIRFIRREKLAAVDVKPEVQERYNAGIQSRFAGTVWASGCKSWYLSSTGRNSTLWPGFTWEYRRITRRFDHGNYQLVKAATLPRRQTGSAHYSAAGAC
jgi:cation diffusion facilitator CzcD-associated flavoprotein CzcO